MRIRALKAIAVAQLVGWRLRDAFRDHWLAILLGCVAGWFFGNVSGAVLVVILGERGIVLSDENVVVFAFSYVWFAIAIGGVIGHRLARKES